MPPTVIRSLGIAALGTALAAVPGASFAQEVRVPGTSVTMAPPAGFVPAQQYPGFEHAGMRASIMVTEMPAPAEKMLRSMTKPALANRGMTLISARDVVIKGFPARLLEVTQQAAGIEVVKWLLIAGDIKTTVMIVGTSPKDSAQEVGEAITQSLLGASWGSGGPPSPFEGLPFRMTPSSKLKLARRLSNMLMFTESGNPGSPGSTEAVYIAGHSLGKGTITDLRAFAEARVRQTAQAAGVKNFTGRTIQVAGLDAHELEADATEVRSGTAMRLYQVIVPDDTGYFIFQGLIRADRADDMLPEFRALTSSFRLVAP